MKKALVFSIIILVLCGSCFAQNTNNAQRIIGTWVTPSGNTTWVFNANGTLTRTSSFGSFNYKFGVADAKLAMAVVYDDGRISESESDSIYNISISSDGRTLILDYIGGSGGETRGVWLTKR